MEFEQTPRPAALHRPLVAADPDIDPHRLVGICCRHAGDEPLSVSLLIPVEDDARPWSESAARAERLLRDVDVLLGAAGIDLEEVVITGEAGRELGELVRFGGSTPCSSAPGTRLGPRACYGSLPVSRESRAWRSSRVDVRSITRAGCGA